MAQLKGIQKATQAVDAIRAILGEKAPSQLISGLMFILSHEQDVDMSAFRDHLGVAQPTAARAAALLSTRKNSGYKNAPGHGFVDLIEHPTEYRRKILRLTPKGRKLQQTILTIMEG